MEPVHADHCMRVSGRTNPNVRTDIVFMISQGNWRRGKCAAEQQTGKQTSGFSHSETS